MKESHLKLGWQMSALALLLILIVLLIGQLVSVKAQDKQNKDLVPTVGKEHDLLMVTTDLFHTNESWRLGLIDPKTYFHIFYPALPTPGGNGMPDWLIFVGPAGPLRQLKLTKPVHFDGDGSVTFTTNEGVFFFPSSIRGGSAKFGKKRLYAPVIRFGQGTYTKPKSVDCPNPTSSPSPKTWNPESISSVLSGIFFLKKSSGRIFERRE